MLANPMYEQRRFECKKLTESEVILISTMEIHARNSVLTGRFLTMHKRRRKKLTTRSLSPDLAPALLDDVHHGLVKVRRASRRVASCRLAVYTYALTR